MRVIFFSFSFLTQHCHLGVVLRLPRSAPSFSVTLEGSAPIKAEAGGEVNSWLAKLPATRGGSKQYSVKVADAGGNSATLTDVLFGDVWVCSGQSNMAFLLENAFNGSNLVADADNYPLLRMFTSKKTSSPSKPLAEQPEVEEPWVPTPPPPPPPGLPIHLMNPPHHVIY